MALSRPSTSGNYNHLSRPSTRADSRRSNEDVFMLESNKSISDASILGTEFAETMMAVNSGVDLGFLEPKTEYSSFKKSIFEDKALIPALRHSHICHGIDAQIREGDRHWNRAGKKFSGEPKIGKTGRETPGGPDKREEFKYVFEKPTKVFGRNRIIAAPRRYERTLSRGAVIPYKPTHDEEYAHLGPGTYTPYNDTWRDHERYVCGMKQESSVFRSPGRYELPPGMGLGSALENDSLTKKTVKEQASHIRPLTSQKRAAATFTHTPTNIRNISLVSEEKNNSNDPNRLVVGWNEDLFPIDSFTSPIRVQSASVSSRSLKSAGRLAAAKKSREPGFKFLAGKMGPSAMDIVTGTTNADLHYRRIKSHEGEFKIVPFYGKDISIPKNAVLVETWATSQEMAEKDDKLQVRMESYGSFDKSIKNKGSPENIDNDDYTYESTADYSQELKYSEELSSSILDGRLSSLELNESYDDHPKSPTTPIQRSLPSSATLQQPIRNYEKGEWKRPMTVSRADEKTKLLQRQHLTEIRKKNHNYTDMKWNRTYNDNENNELVVPIRVADTMPIMNNTNKQILVKKNTRGGGDVLGGSRGRSRGKLHTFSFLTENSSLLTEGFI